MRMIVLSAVFALGLGIAGASTASAATDGTGLTNTANQVTTDMSARRCWWVRRCWHGRYSGRRCSSHRVCRGW